MYCSYVVPLPGKQFSICGHMMCDKFDSSHTEQNSKICKICTEKVNQECGPIGRQTKLMLQKILFVCKEPKCSKFKEEFIYEEYFQHLRYHVTVLMIEKQIVLSNAAQNYLIKNYRLISILSCVIRFLKDLMTNFKHIKEFAKN